MNSNKVSFATNIATPYASNIKVVNIYITFKKEKKGKNKFRLN